MELILERNLKRKAYTTGRLYIQQQVVDEYLPSTEDKYFCDTLESTWRDYAHGAYKVRGHSAIPEGRYPVVITFSAKQNMWLPLLLGVPKFKDVRIHADSSAQDAEGYILVGKQQEAGMLTDSRPWLQRLKRTIVDAKARGEGVWITVR